MSAKCKANRDAKKAARLEQANALIHAISSHGRRFFYCEDRDRIAKFEIQDKRIKFIDDWSGMSMQCLEGRRWKGFSHGGTMKNLIQKLSNYIRLGEKLNIGIIAPAYLFGPVQSDIEEGEPESNIWGYPDAAKKALLEQINGMELFE
jgi:hypothetical protein